MNLSKNRLAQAGITLAVIAILVLATPKAAHAVAALLVQVTNTPAAPVISQGVPTLASQIVTLVPSASGSFGIKSASAFTLSSLEQWSAAVKTGGLEPSAQPYTVPAGQSLVITTIDLAEAAPAGTDTVIVANSALPNGQYTVAPLPNWVATLLVPCSTNPTTTQFHFSPGLVFPAGENIWMAYFQGINGNLIAEAHGYLTAQ